MPPLGTGGWFQGTPRGLTLLDNNPTPSSTPTSGLPIVTFILTKQNHKIIIRPHRLHKKAFLLNCIQ